LRKDGGKDFPLAQPGRPDDLPTVFGRFKETDAGRKRRLMFESGRFRHVTKAR
jgi:hypothetical protein